MSKLQKACLGFIVVLGIASLWVSISPPHGTYETDAVKALEPPGFGVLFGRDSLGRNLFYRVLEGAQVSISIGLASSALAFLIGLFIGSGISLLPRQLEALCLRGIEILLALPHLMLMAILFLILQTALGSAFSELALITVALALGSWMSMARITRNLLRSEMTKDYIQGAKAVGASWPRIVVKHLFPNILSTLLVFWSLQIPQALLAEGALSFLGFGVKSPHVSWGLLLQDGWRSLASYPHLLLGPSLALFLTVFSFNILLRRPT